MPVIDTYPEPFIAPSTVTRLNVVLEVLPAETVDFKVWLPRVKVGSVEVLVRMGMTIDEDADSVGKRANFTLVNPADKSLFTPAALIDVGIGEIEWDGTEVEAVTGFVRRKSSWVEATMGWEILGGRLEGISRNESGFGKNTGDAVSIVVGTFDKLSKTSATGLILYDSNKLSIGATDYKPIYDSQENAYTPVVEAIAGLTLGDLFNRVFITECGFTEINTDLPLNDYFIDQYSVGMGERFYDGIKGFIGMYRVNITQEGNKITILDGTVAVPSGVTSPRAVTADDVTGLKGSSDRVRLDAFKLQFTGLANNYDYTTFRYEYPVEGGGDNRVEYEKIFVEFRKITGPGKSVVIRDPLNIDNKTTYADGIEVGQTSDVFEFTPEGRYASRRKVVHALIPDLLGASIVPFKQIIAREDESFVYSPHPFKKKSTYLQSRQLRRAGLVTVDTDNPNAYGDPAKQEAEIAFRSNNIADGQTYAYQTLSTRSEISTPQPDGSVNTRVLVIDRVNPSQPLDFIENRPGDIGTSSHATVQKELMVFPDDVAVRSTDAVENFPVGPLPLKYALPLCRRALIQDRTASEQVNAPLVGYDRTLKKGKIVTVLGRDNAEFGKYSIVSRRINCDAEGLTMDLGFRQLAASSNTIQLLNSYSAFIDSNAVQIWTIPVECLAGKFLSVSPQPGSNITIGAKRAVDPAWINIEITPIDLSPWTGTTQSFEFRLIAPVVLVPTDASFAIITS